jgi:hypothetical protein
MFLLHACRERVVGDGDGKKRLPLRKSLHGLSFAVLKK